MGIKKILSNYDFKNVRYVQKSSTEFDFIKLNFLYNFCCNQLFSSGVDDLNQNNNTTETG